MLTSRIAAVKFQPPRLKKEKTKPPRPKDAKDAKDNAKIDDGLEVPRDQGMCCRTGPLLICKV